MAKFGTVKSRSGPTGELRADAQQELVDDKSLPRLIRDSRGDLTIAVTSNGLVDTSELRTDHSLLTLYSLYGSGVGVCRAVEAIFLDCY